MNLVHSPETVRVERMPHRERGVQLLDTAEALVLGEGIGAVTMQRIADLAKVAKPVVYRHYSNVSALLLAVLERRWSEIDRDLNAIFEVEGDFESGVAARVEHYLVGMADDRYRIRKLLAAAESDRSVQLAWRRRLDRRTQDLAHILALRFGLQIGAANTLSTLCIGALSRLGDKVTEAVDPPHLQASRYARFIKAGIEDAREGS